jgi:hypothetical protein
MEASQRIWPWAQAATFDALRAAAVLLAAGSGLWSKSRPAGRLAGTGKGQASKLARQLGRHGLCRRVMLMRSCASMVAKPRGDSVCREQ